MTCIFPPECAVMRVHTQACPRWTSTLCPTSWLTWTYPGKLWPGLGILMTFPLPDFILTSISAHSCSWVKTENNNYNRGPGDMDCFVLVLLLMMLWPSSMLWLSTGTFWNTCRTGFVTAGRLSCWMSPTTSCQSCPPGEQMDLFKHAHRRSAHTFATSNQSSFPSCPSTRCPFWP